MNNTAFFFNGDALLLPEDADDSQIDKGFPMELADNFINPDIFEIPDLKYSGLTNEDPVIRAVSVLDTPKNWRTIQVRQVLSILSACPEKNPERILRACHIAQWRHDSRFCGRCGAKNIEVRGELQRRCPGCGKIEFPRICPAMIVMITNDENQILLAHNRRFRKGVYSHISGFNEAGETLEETVVREIREEVNIEVKDIEYIKSQPWPFPNSLMVGFKARYLSGVIKPDGDEIEDAKWFSRDNLPELPGEGSLSRFLINRWLDA